MPAVKTERVLQAAIALCLALLAWVVGRAMREPRVVQVGDTAPNFAVTTDNGRRLAGDDFGGRLLVLHFWATWCAPCVEEIPTLNRFYQQFANSGVVVLGISVDENEKDYQAFLSRFEVTFPTARDPEARISARYGTFKYPETYIINRDRRVVMKIVSNRDWTSPDMVRHIQALLRS
jgi:peroxiredoxin